MFIYIYIYLFIYVIIYVQRERERARAREKERERCIYMITRGATGPEVRISKISQAPPAPSPLVFKVI